MSREIDKQLVRDCYAQTRSIRRLMLQLTDDLGDLSAAHTDVPMFEQWSDALADMEHRLHVMQEALLKGSRP